MNIDYSTGPKVRYPQAHEECYDVLTWVRGSGSSMGWDNERVSIGGGSAGANLALGALELARRAGDPAARTCVLLVPPLTRPSRPSSTPPPFPRPLVRTPKAPRWPGCGGRVPREED